MKAEESAKAEEPVKAEEPKKADLTLAQKMKLYDGKMIPGFTEDNVKELRKETSREGMDGISPRYVQDKLSNSLVNDASQSCINPFMVLNELEAGLKHHSLITSDEQRKRYAELLSVVREEYDWARIARLTADVYRRVIAERAITDWCGACSGRCLLGGIGGGAMLRS